MKRFLRDVLTAGRAGEDRRAEWALHWLLAASIALPLAVLAVGSAISYRQHLAEARGRLQRDLGTAYEHALKVFETFEISARYVDELFQYVSDAQIRAFENEYHAQLRTLTETLPQLADIWIIDRDAQIRAFENEYHAQLRTLAETLPQLADIWIIYRDAQIRAFENEYHAQLRT